jgi:hypothetical protein
MDHVAALLLVVWSPSLIVCRLRRGCPTSLCSNHFVAGARKGLHACRSARLVLVVVDDRALYTIRAYRSPSAGHHEVLGLLVCECDKAGMNVSTRIENTVPDKRPLTAMGAPTQERPLTRVFFCGSGPPAGAG